MRFIVLFILLVIACRPSNQISELVGVMNERPLEGTDWRLIELNGKEVILSQEHKDILVFYQHENNQVRGFAGCNSFMGSYVKEGSTIIARLSSTRMFCEGKMDTETELLNILNEKTKYEIKGSHLFLKIKGEIVAKFLAEIETSR